MGPSASLQAYASSRKSSTSMHIVVEFSYPKLVLIYLTSINCIKTYFLKLQYVKCIYTRTGFDGRMERLPYIDGILWCGVSLVR